MMRHDTSLRSTLLMAVFMAAGISTVPCYGATAHSRQPYAAAQGKIATAQVKAADADDADDRMEARPADVSGLAGKTIDYASYKKYVTTGRPTDDGDKVFLLYNVGTGKFLNVGSYWGTHAALSNVPRPFWFQRRNEDTSAGQYAYVRYPEKTTTNTGYFYNDFFAVYNLQVGNTQGNHRSHIEYVYLQVVDAKTGAVVKDIIPQNTNAEGAENSFMEELPDFDFSKYSIKARLNMAGCTATESGSGNMETLLSMGPDVSKWSYGVSDLHIYGYRSGGKSYVRVQPVDSKYKDSTHKSGGSENPITVGDDNIVDILVSQQSVLVNNVQCMPRIYTYDSAIKPLLALSTFNVGSCQGDVRTHATYNYVLTHTTSLYDSDPTHVVRPNLACEGRAFSKTFSGTLADLELTAVVDLTACTGTNENILSVGNDISEWYNKTTTTSQNLHMFYTASSKEFKIQTVNKDHQNGQPTATIKNVTGKVTIKVNKTGVYFNDEKQFDETNPVLAYLIANATEIQVGSEQGEVRSNATYVSTTVTDYVSPEPTGNVCDDGYAPGGAKFSRSFTGSLADKAVEASIDISKCKATNENILSIGTNISEWGYKDNTQTSYNIHFYRKTSTQVQVDPVVAGNNYRTYVNLTADDNSTVTVRLSSDGLWVNDKQLFTADNEIVKHLLDEASSIQVGSREGDNRSNATYNYLRMVSTATSDTDASEAAARPAPRRAVADSGTKDTYIYKDKACDGTAFKSADVTVDFSKNEYIEADIDLSTCTTSKENVFSIGTDISQWGNQGTAHNLHFYYLETTTHDGSDAYLLQVAYVNKDHPDDYKRALYVPVGQTLHIKLSKDGLVVNGTDVYPASDPMPKLVYSDHPELAGDIVRIAQDSYGNRLIDSSGHFIIDQENGHGVKSTVNGYIYTTESRTDKTMPLFISSRFKQQTTSNGNEDVFLAWAPYLKNSNKWGNIGVYADRALPSAELTADQSVACSQWYFEEAPGSTENNRMYRIYVQMTDVQKHEIGSDGKLQLVTVSGKQKFYLQPDTDEMLGNGFEKYPDGSDLSQFTSVEAKTALPEGDDAANAYWKVFSMNEYYTMFQSEKSEMTSMLDLSFLLHDASFSRENSELDYWHMDKGLEGKVRIGYDHYSKKTTADTDYSDENGNHKSTGGDYSGTTSEYQAMDKRTSNHARYMGVDVRNGGYGQFYQDVTLDKQGWYAVTCGGMTNVGAKLFVQVVTDPTAGTVSAPVYQPLHALTASEIATFNATKQTWPFDYVSGGLPMYNALVAINDDAIQPNYKAKYTSQVAFYVDPEVLADHKGKLTLRFGVEVPQLTGTQTAAADGTATQSDDDTTTGSTADQWTVFDDFHLLFGGNAQEPNLMLDEDFTSMDYLDQTAHVFNLHPLRLHRTFNGGKWNTLILPVNLSQSDFTTMFGSEARLAQLDHLTDHSIEFVSAPTEGLGSESTGTDDSGNATSKDIYLRAFKPYIVWVDEKHAKGNGKDGDGQAYSAPLANRANTSKFTTVSVPADHFYLESVSLAARHTDEADQYYYDFKGDTKQQQDITFPFATAHTTGDLYTYRDDVVARDASNTNSPLRAYGTLCKNFEGKTISTGRPTLGGGYILKDGTMYRIKSQYGTKGLRCWFMPETTDGQQLSSEVKVAIDGVEDTTTSIADIFADADPVAARYADGIYNAAGQKVAADTAATSSLAPGLYIVGGRKFVKTAK